MSEGKVKVHNTGKSDIGVTLQGAPALRFKTGMVTEVTAEEWNAAVNRQSIKAFVDEGRLVVVDDSGKPKSKKAGKPAAKAATTTTTPAEGEGGEGEGSEGDEGGDGEHAEAVKTFLALPETDAIEHLKKVKNLDMLYAFGEAETREAVSAALVARIEKLEAKK